MAVIIAKVIIIIYDTGNNKNGDSFKNTTQILKNKLLF